MTGSSAVEGPSGAGGQEVVRYEVDAGVALVTLSRPEKLNAWTLDMGVQYAAALERATASPEVRAVVVTGAGRGFCAGADMSLLTEISASGGVPGAEAVRGTGHRHVTLEPQVPKPVVAAVNGVAAGLGFVRAALCDVRFAGESARFTTAFARRGLVAEHGISWLLPRIVGFSRALDLLLSARTVDACEAAAMGLVDRVVPDDALLDHALDWARDVAASCAPASLRDAKAQVWRDAGDALEPSLERAMALMADSFGRPELVEGVASHLERRPPRFPGLSG